VSEDIRMFVAVVVVVPLALFSLELYGCKYIYIFIYIHIYVCIYVLVGHKRTTVFGSQYFWL